MHRLHALTAPLLLVLLLSLLTACASFTNPLTGTTVGGGTVARTSLLLGTPLPLGMEYYAEHSRIEGQDGMEVLRGSASPAMCARTVCDALQQDGWTARLAYATETRALYVFEKNGRTAAVNILPQANLTLMTLYVSSTAPASLPIPVIKKADHSFNFGFGSSSSSNSSGNSDSSGSSPYDSQGIPAQEEGTGGLSTAPEAPYGAGGAGSSGVGHVQERDL